MLDSALSVTVSAVSISSLARSRETIPFFEILEDRLRRNPVVSLRRLGAELSNDARRSQRVAFEQTDEIVGRHVGVLRRDLMSNLKAIVRSEGG
jgi:hypothetical protein